MSGLDTLIFITIEDEKLTLRDARQSWFEGYPYELRPPTMALFDGVAAVDEEAAAWLVDLLAHYRAYVPPLDVDVRDQLLLRAITLSTGDRVAFEVALALVAIGPAAIAGMLARVPQQTVDESTLYPLGMLLSYLLDHPVAHPIVHDAVATWRDTPTAAAIRGFIF